MKHLVLFLYILSLMASIGAVTVGSFFYFKFRNRGLGYIILAGVFSTLMQILDICNYYIQVISSDFSHVANLVLMFGMMAVNVGLIYYFTLAVHHFTGKGFSGAKKVAYFASAVGAFAVVWSAAVYLHRYGLISERAEKHTGFFISNLFNFVGCVYNVYLLVVNINRVPEIVRKAVIFGLAVVGIIAPLSVLSNIIGYLPFFPRYPVAFSPLGNLLLSGICLTFAARYFLSEEYRNHSSVTEAGEPALRRTVEDLLKGYGLSEREQEIAGLVVEGCNNKEIGERLFISANTVRNHVYSIYRKMGIKSRYELINASSALQSLKARRTE